MEEQLMVRLFALCSMIVFIGTSSRSDDDKKTAVDGPSSKNPELKALDHYVGVWNVEFTNKDLPFKGAKSTAKWILDGRFVEQTGELESKEGGRGLKIKTLYTFDAKKNAFRSWTFDSEGSITESDCVWDDKAKTMTSISKKIEGEGFATTTADFSEEGVEKWKIAISDSTGKVTAEIIGKNTLEKKK
jgi:hypothetical protein